MSSRKEGANEHKMVLAYNIIYRIVLMKIILYNV